MTALLEYGERRELERARKISQEQRNERARAQLAAGTFAQDVHADREAQRARLFAAALEAGQAAADELAAALAAGPGAACCVGCGCVRVLMTSAGLVCALCGAAA